MPFPKYGSSPHFGAYLRLFPALQRAKNGEFDGLCIANVESTFLAVSRSRTHQSSVKASTKSTYTLTYNAISQHIERCSRHKVISAL